MYKWDKVLLLLFALLLVYRCDKVFKNGPSEICGRQPLKNLKWYDLWYDIPSIFFRRLPSTNFTWFILEYFVPSIILKILLKLTISSYWYSITVLPQAQFWEVYFQILRFSTKITETDFTKSFSILWMEKLRWNKIKAELILFCKYALMGIIFTI